MKANEFIRVFGLDIARMAISECTPECNIDTVEVKRLVESHELVESYGSIGQAKFWVDMMAGADSMQKKTDRVKQAIADVEACQ